MNIPTRKRILITLFVVVVFMMSLSVFFEFPRNSIELYLAGREVSTAFFYVGVLIITTVIAPFVGLPLAPLTSITIGPLITALLSVLGWTIGAGIAFGIARYVGRPLLCHFVDMKKVERYERYVPERHIFFWLVFLRILIPVDVLSYAIGLASTVRFPIYIVATAIGVAPFSFVWVYGGHAIIEKNYTVLGIASLSGLALFVVALYGYWRRRHKK